MSKSDVQAFERLIQTVHRLRAPGGCPWDREQTHQSLRPYLIEEAYEALDVLDRIHSPEDLKKPEIQGAFKEELGDVLMQVALHSEMTSEAGAFGLADVADFLNEKLIRRHPHVFGDVQVDSAEAAFKNWEKQKAKEKAGNLSASILDGVPKGLPALQRAGRVIEKVTKVGFQWPDLAGPLDKMDEEFAELKVELAKLREATDAKKPEADLAPLRERVSSELGDVFFCLANVAHLLKIQPEDTLRAQLSRFEGRFKHIERRLKEQGRTPDQASLEEMDVFWDEAKKMEKDSVGR